MSDDSDDILGTSFVNSLRQIRTRNGIVVEVSQDIWEYGDKLVDVRLDFSSLPVAEQIKKSIKLTLEWYAENKSPDYLRNIFTYLSYMLEYIRDSTEGDVSQISCEMLISYRSTLSKRKEYHLGYITSFLKKWYDLCHPGIAEDVIQYIESIDLAGNPKGEYVRTQDPNRGQFSDIEFQGINRALREGYSNGKILLEDFLLGWLFLAKGHRPIQYASLKVGDFIAAKNNNGDTTYLLDVPRAKQANCFVRDSFKKNRIIPQIGVQFEEHIRMLAPVAARVGMQHGDMPMFPRKQIRANAPTEYAWHHTGKSLSTRIKYVINSLGIISERTGQRLAVNPRRFRYTLGSRMAIEGHSKLVIAEALDHTTAGDVSVYTDNDPAIIKHIDQAMALALAPLAQVFLGEIVADEAEIALGKDACQISDPRFDSAMKPMGSCSQAQICGALAPLECYLCPSFRAWQDGPHATVLEYLLKERDRLTKQDLRIAANCDRLILAVADVVNQCRQIKIGILGV